MIDLVSALIGSACAFAPAYYFMRKSEKEYKIDLEYANGEIKYIREKRDIALKKKDSIILKHQQNIKEFHKNKVKENIKDALYFLFEKEIKDSLPNDCELRCIEGVSKTITQSIYVHYSYTTAKKEIRNAKICLFLPPTDPLKEELNCVSMLRGWLLDADNKYSDSKYSFLEEDK